MCINTNYKCKNEIYIKNIKIQIFYKLEHFMRDLESLQISISPFTCTMKDSEFSLPIAKGEKIAMKKRFLGLDIYRAHVQHLFDMCPVLGHM